MAYKIYSYKKGELFFAYFYTRHKIITYYLKLQQKKKIRIMNFKVMSLYKQNIIKIILDNHFAFGRLHFTPLHELFCHVFLKRGKGFDFI